MNNLRLESLECLKNAKKAVETLLKISQGHRIKEDDTTVLSFCMSRALLVVSLVLVVLLKHLGHQSIACCMLSGLLSNGGSEVYMLS